MCCRHFPVSNGCLCGGIRSEKIGGGRASDDDALPAFPGVGRLPLRRHSFGKDRGVFAERHLRRGSGGEGPAGIRLPAEPGILPGTSPMAGVTRIEWRPIRPAVRTLIAYADRDHPQVPGVRTAAVRGSSHSIRPAVRTLIACADRDHPQVPGVRTAAVRGSSHSIHTAVRTLIAYADRDHPQVPGVRTAAVRGSRQLIRPAVRTLIACADRDLPQVPGVRTVVVRDGGRVAR